MREIIKRPAFAMIQKCRKAAWKADSMRFVNKRLHSSVREVVSLTNQENKDIESFFKKCGYRTNTKYHQWYYSVTGLHDVRFLPDWFLSCELSAKLNDLRMADAWTDKAYLERYIPGSRNPFTLLRNVNGELLDHAFEPISVDNAQGILNDEERVIVKPSVESGGGMNVNAFNSPLSYEALLSRYRSNFVVQHVLKQHPSTAVFNESSVNTIRIISMLWGGVVHICGIMLRTGINGAITDNVSHGQGLSFMLYPDGKIGKVCYSFEGLAFDTVQHFGVNPDHHVASVIKAIEFIKYHHKRLLYFKLIAWDIAIEEDGEVTLVEYNTSSIGITLFQYNVGPLFGELTQEVLSYYGHGGK